MTEFVLKPCPFCGGNAQSLRCGSWQTSCTECHAGTPMSFDERELAEVAWNHRAASPQPVVGDREAVARIVDPEIWTDWEATQKAIPNIHPEEYSGKFVIARSLAKADAILASLASRPEGGWRPIETAPRDGTKIIGQNKFDEVFRMWWWEFEEGPDWQDDGDSEQRPLRWMPLPPPPSGEGGD